LSFETNFDFDPFAEWYNVRVYPEAEGICVYFQIKTTQKQAEEVLRKCEERLRAVMKSEEDAVP
jgi:hypothetical protein